MTVSLAELRILALDCQATGPNPQKGHLLELGWMAAGASPMDKLRAPGAQTYLSRLPADENIPRAVSRITGISDASLRAAKPSRIIWQHLMDAVAAVAAENQTAVCPTVIHFARFEAPFLKDLHRRNDPDSPFPFQIICTHEIATRLLPDLPRRGLRAIAGYFNHSMPEFKRSADHVVATAVIWQRMVEILSDRPGIGTLDQLVDWLASPAPAGRSRRIYPMAPEKRLPLPDQPGIYRMLRANSDLLYIGKAKSLKMRVNSYFRSKAPHAEHILEMLTQAQKLEFTRTGTAVEAALLESDEIKRHSPPYNIALRRRQRNLVFCTKGLRRHSPVADRNCVVGPLPGGKFIEAVLAFGDWIARDGCWTDDEVAARGGKLLGLAPGYGPDPACLQEGLTIFRQEQVNPLKHQSPLRLLTGLGANLWRQKMEAAEAAEMAAEDMNQNENDEAQPEDTAKERVWTPEAVANSLGYFVLHSAHLIRRARWLCLLSESSLAWEAAGKPGHLHNRIVLQGGAVTRLTTGGSAEEIPIPPRADRSVYRRQKQLDLITYDRLRVLTTELRRLMAENRRMKLRLGPTVLLGNNELKKALRWV
jgi:DNA polymerase-3 subunit epsilon